LRSGDEEYSSSLVDFGLSLRERVELLPVFMSGNDSLFFCPFFLHCFSQSILTLNYLGFKRKSLLGLILRDLSGQEEMKSDLLGGKRVNSRVVDTTWK
jgi:hypothetical protein